MPCWNSDDAYAQYICTFGAYTYVMYARMNHSMIHSMIRIYLMHHFFGNKQTFFATSIYLDYDNHGSQKKV